MTGYVEVGGGFAIARLRVGVSLRSPDGREVYFQPGDDSAAILDTVEALDEVDEVPEAAWIANPNLTDEESAAARETARDRVAAIALGDYFA